MTAIWFALAAAFGALARHNVNQLGYGWKGTLGVNIIGSFALGALMSSGASTDLLTVVGTGGCGGLTTFSMFSLETVELHGAARLGIVSTTIAGTVGAAALGYAII